MGQLDPKILTVKNQLKCAFLTTKIERRIMFNIFYFESQIKCRFFENSNGIMKQLQERAILKILFSKCLRQKNLISFFKFLNFNAEMLQKDFFKVNEYLLESHLRRVAGTASFFAKRDLVQLRKTELKNGDDTLLVDVDNVSEVLGNLKYKDCYAAIYTIAGPTRGGKSFLLSLLFQFLQQNKRENSYEEW